MLYYVKVFNLNYGKVSAMVRKTFIVSIMFFLCVGFCYSASFEVGTGVVNITGPDAVVLDPLQVKAIVLRQGSEQFVIVECDLGGVRKGLADEAKKIIQEKCGIPIDRICIAATHTHMTGSVKPNLAEPIAEAVIQATKAMRAVKIESIIGIEFQIAHNRRYWMKNGTVRFNPMFLNPDIVCAAGPIDPEVNFMLFRDAKTDKPVSSLASYALHCDTVKEYGARYQKSGAGSAKAVSADYPYWLEEFLQEKFGDSFTSVFGAGCSGNINHWDFSKPGPQSGHKTTTKHLGKSLADAVLEELGNSKNVDGSLAVRNRVVQVPLRSFTAEDLTWARQLDKSKTSGKSEEMSERDQFLNNVKKRRILRLEKMRKESDTIPLLVQVIRLDNEIAIVTLPGEMFVENGSSIKNLSPFENTMVIELANNSCGYVPNRKAYPQGAYEVVNSIIAPGGAEIMMQAAVEMLEELKEKSKALAAK